jgi:hypothetical protein
MEALRRSVEKNREAKKADADEKPAKKAKKGA